MAELIPWSFMALFYYGLPLLVVLYLIRMINRISANIERIADKFDPQGADRG